MSSTTSPPATNETSDLISSDKVEGTAVYNRSGDRLGSVYNFMVNKRSGKVAYAVMSFGGFLGMGASYHPLPWDQLTYDPVQGGYIVNFAGSNWKGRQPTRSRRAHYGMTLLTAEESTITTLRSEGGFSLATSWSKVRPIIAYRDGSRIWMPPVAAGIGFTPECVAPPNGVVPSGDDVLRTVAIAVCIVAGIIAMVAGSLPYRRQGSRQHAQDHPGVWIRAQGWRDL